MEITDKSLFIEQFGKVAACHVVPNKSTNNYPIVFVHGAWGGKYQFKDWQQYSAAHGWESYAVDLPGHYQSPCNELGTISIRDYANVIEQVVQQIGPCSLIGHSTSGLIVQVVASRCAQVKKTVLLASVPVV
jgi:pimeloyl-ACP methyl ester carboxylesterase